MFHQRSDNFCMSKKCSERQRCEFVVTSNVRIRATIEQHAHHSQPSMLRRAHQRRDAMCVAQAFWRAASGVETVFCVNDITV
jgi:hypothetical protein